MNLIERFYLKHGIEKFNKEHLSRNFSLTIDFIETWLNDLNKYRLSENPSLTIDFIEDLDTGSVILTNQVIFFTSLL